MTARVEILLEARDRGAAAAMRELGSSSARAGAEVDAGGRKAAGGMGAMAALARTGALALAAAAGAAVKLGIDSVSAASDVQQSMGALEAVYGRNAAAVKAWAAGAAEDVGLSKAAYADFAATIGAGLKNAGIEDYAGSTQKLIGLGADLAAQFGGSTSQAIDALGSLMRGESDPIERYGVSINQTAVAAYLAARGQDNLTGAARRQAEMQARLALVMQQTRDAQGAFARESDTAAGAQQRLAANFENVKAQIGAGLLPYVARLTGGLSDTLAGSNRLGRGLRSMAAVIMGEVRPFMAAARTEATRIRAAFVNAAGGSDNLRRAGRLLWQGFVTLAGFIGGTAVTSVRVASAVFRAYAAVIDTLRGFGESARSAISRLVSTLRSAPNTGAWQTAANVLDRIAGAAQNAVNWVGNLLGKIGSAASGLAGLTRGAGGGIGAGLARAQGAGLLAGSIAAPAFTYNAAPVLVSVNLDYRGLRRLIRQEVIAETRAPRSVLS